jgi:hypothetical protein
MFLNTPTADRWPTNEEVPTSPVYPDQLLFDCDYRTITAGIDVPAGDYTIKHNSGYPPSLFIKSPEEISAKYISHLTNDPMAEDSTFRVVLFDGESVELTPNDYGDDEEECSVLFESTEASTFSGTMNNGIWRAGIDFPVGIYTVSPSIFTEWPNRPYLALFRNDTLFDEIGFNYPEISIRLSFERNDLVVLAGTPEEFVFADSPHLPFTGTLGEGVWFVGTDIPAGFYDISWTEKRGVTGALVVEVSRNGEVDFLARLTETSETVRVRLIDGDELYLRGPSVITLTTPGSTVFTGTLGPGTWLGGEDIPSGNYAISLSPNTWCYIKMSTGSEPSIAIDPTVTDSIEIFDDSELTITCLDQEWVVIFTPA